MRKKSLAVLLALAMLVNLGLLYLCQTVVAWGVVWLLRRVGAGAGLVELANELYTLVVYLAVFLPPYLLYARCAGCRWGSCPPPGPICRYWPPGWGPPWACPPRPSCRGRR